jgi:hypothetical protein
MIKSLHELPDVYRLGDTTKVFLQVLLKEFTLKKSGKGKVIEIPLSDDNLCIRESRTRQILNEWIKSQKNDCANQFAEQFKQFDQDENLLAYHFNCKEFPFRHSNGGVLPIIKLGVKEYFCLFYRDIAPVGWNIANGGSGNIDELLHPQKVLFREFSEELIVVDDKTKNLYEFDMFEEGLQYGIEIEVLKAWSDRLSNNYQSYNRLPIPIKWVDGPDKMIVEYKENRYTSDGCFLSITPEDNAIEFDKVAFMNLRDINLLDGELTRYFKRNTKKYLLFNRVIGLFQVDRFFRKLNQNEFIPDLFYYNGEKIEKKANLDSCIRQYLDEIKLIRNEKEIALMSKQPYPKNLCPVTRSLIQKYLNWVNEEKKITYQNEQYILEKKQMANKDFKIFISYKSEDRQLANALYQFLTLEKKDLKNKVFYSDQSIMQIGESDYAQIIDQALEKANCLIVVGSHPEYLDTGWVGYEWRSFLNEIRSNRKKKGKVFTFTNGIFVEQLPYALRSVQNIPFNPASPQDSFEKLYAYV